MPFIDGNFINRHIINFYCWQDLEILDLNLSKRTNMNNNYLLFLIVCIVTTPIFSQGPSQQYLDMIGYEELLALYNDFESDSTTQKKIILTYRNRAEKEGDILKVARSYDRLARIFTPQKNIQYADSLIDYTKDWDNITYPAAGYLLKSYEYSRLGDLQQSYSNLLKANDKSEANENITQKIYILDRLISLKISWGDAEKALEMQKIRHDILLEKNFIERVINLSRPGFDANEFYLQNIISSYEAFILCNVALGNYNTAKKYLVSHDSILHSYKGFDKEQIVHWQVDAEMEINYFMGNYKKSIDFSNSSLEINSHVQDPYYYLNANLYKGLSLYKLKAEDLAQKYLYKADSIFRLKPNLLPTYSGKLLYNNLVEFNYADAKKKVEYYDILLNIDSLSLVNYKILEPQFIRTFETPELLRSKEKTIEKLKAKNRNSLYMIIVSILVIISSSLLAWSYYRQKIVYRRRYEKLMKAEKLSDKSDANSDNESNKSQLSHDIVNDIMRKLEKFEKNKDFLNSSLSLMSLAKKFNTNSSYLSRVLNSSKSINFSHYLNDLRIDFAVSKIKNDAVFRKYTIEAIAVECGYNNSASFSRSFYKKTGIHPSYFINEIIKDQKAE